MTNTISLFSFLKFSDKEKYKIKEEEFLEENLILY